VWIWAIIALFGKDVLFWFLSSPTFVLIIILLGLGAVGLIAAGIIYFN